MEYELEMMTISRFAPEIIISGTGWTFFCFSVVADGNLVKGERFPRRAPFRRRGNLRLLLNYHQQQRENNKKVHPVPKL